MWEIVSFAADWWEFYQLVSGFLEAVVGNSVADWKEVNFVVGEKELCQLVSE